MNSFRNYFSEFIGTYFLVLFGVGAVYTDALSNGALGLVGISLAWGMIIISLVYAIGDISGAHLNPAVTFGFFFSNLISFKDAMFFTIFQFIGACAASFTLMYIYPEVTVFGGTLPSVNSGTAFLIEFIMTFFLMFVIVNLSYGSKQKGITSGIAVGCTVAFLVMISGPLTGASLNPARSFGPAFAAGNFKSLWIYMSAPFLGAGCAVATYSYIFAVDAENNRKKIRRLFTRK